MSSPTPVTRREMLLALMPVFFFPLLLPAGVLLAPLLLAYACKEGFPRWSYPLWGFAVLVAAYLQAFHGTIFGHWVDGNWWAWLPVIGGVLSGLLWARSLEPLRNLFRSVWDDWSLPAFAVYGGIPLMLMAAYDEVHGRLLMNLLQYLLLGGGALLYLHQRTPRRRFAVLAGSFALTWGSLIIHQCWYWNGRFESGMPFPGSWQNTLRWSSRMGGGLLLVLSLPLLLPALKRLFPRH